MIVHSYPVNDRMPHNTDSPDCKCNPRIIHVKNGMIVAHNSFDGREFREMGEAYSEANKN